jgi:hypothetical protein
MKKETFLFAALFPLIFFWGCNQKEPNSCTVTTEQFIQLIGAEDSVVRKILPDCFKVDRRGDFREFTYYINLYNIDKADYYNQFSVSTSRNNKSVYFTTSNPGIYESYKTELLNSGFVNDSIEYGERVYLKKGYKLKLSEFETNGQNRYSIYVAKINDVYESHIIEDPSWLPTVKQVLSLAENKRVEVDSILLPYFSRMDSQYIRQYDYQNEHHMDQILVYRSSKEINFGTTVGERAWIYKKKLIDYGFKQNGEYYRYKDYIMRESSNISTSMGSYNKMIYWITVGLSPD